MPCCKKKGFSLIEMLIVIAVIAFSIPAIFTIFFIILQQQTRIARLSEVKKQGTFISNNISSLIKNNAVGIYNSRNGTEICSNNAIQKTYSGALHFKDRFGQWFDFISGSDKISSESSATSTVDLSSTKVIVSSVAFSQCSYPLSGVSAPIATFSYDVCYKIGSGCGSPDQAATLHFSSTVKLRTY